MHQVIATAPPPIRVNAKIFEGGTRAKDGLNAFNYFGNKKKWLNFIIPLLSPAPPRRVRHRIEAFCGSASITLNLPAPPKHTTGLSIAETINDTNLLITNFFRQLRDHPDELTRLINLTPNSRAEFEHNKTLDWTTQTDIERARLFFIHNTCSSHMHGSTDPAAAIWQVTAEHVAGPGFDRSQQIADRKSRLPRIATRLKAVTIEHSPADTLLKLHCHRPKTLLYLDPPYLNTTRNYLAAAALEGTDPTKDPDWHHRLLTQITDPAVKAMVAISTYKNDLYTSTLTAAGWHLYHCTIGPRTEQLWTNYTPLPFGAQDELLR